MITRLALAAGLAISLTAGAHGASQPAHASTEHVTTSLVAQRPVMLKAYVIRYDGTHGDPLKLVCLKSTHRVPFQLGDLLGTSMRKRWSAAHVVDFQRVPRWDNVCGVAR